MVRPGKTLRAKRRIYRENAKQSECKGLTVIECNAKDNCKTVNGPKLQYCRNLKNKKLTSEMIRLNKSDSNVIVSRKNKKIVRKRQTYRKPHAPKVAKHIRRQNRISVNREFSKMAIHKDQLFNEPCVVLSKLKRYFGDKLYRFTKENVKDIDNLLPVMYRESSGVYMYGKEKVEIGSKIGEGSYGIIFKAKHNNKDIAIKELRPSDFQLGEFLSETIIQNELYCLGRGKFGNGARIPKIEFFGKVRDSTGRFKYIIGMETLDIDGYDFLDQTSLDRDIRPVYDMLMQISELESKLQSSAKFMHRDLHLGNVMAKKTATGHKWYIIDFGMSYMQIDNNIVSSGGTYTKSKIIYNETHDLRMLIVSLFSTLYRQLKDQFSTERFHLFSNITICMNGLKIYYKHQRETMFWNTYTYVVNIKDDSFKPMNIHKFAALLLNNYTIGNLYNIKKMFKNIIPKDLRTNQAVKANRDNIIKKRIEYIFQLTLTL